jgi:hypothetical protein
MRSRYKPPLKRRYFHTKPKMDKRDMTILKKKIEVIKQKKNKKELEDHIL